MAQLIDWARGLDPDAIDLIHIRDWHDADDPAQREHLERFGAHCIKGVVAIREQTHFTGQTDAYVGELAVASGMERRGIATALMNAAEAWAVQRGLAFLTLHTGAANGPARSLYRQLGYQKAELLLIKRISGRPKHGQPHLAQEPTTAKSNDEA